MKRSGLILSLLFLTLSIAAFANAPAYSFTKGKTIEILVGYSPGGGHDVEARLIAR